MAARGVVVACLPEPGDHASEHERVTLLGFARRLAALKDYGDGGLHQPGQRYAGPVYFVPSSPLTSAQAAGLGIAGPDDLFGGVVPQAFVATKVIGHPLVAPDAAAVPGWNPAFASRVADAVLAGYVAFEPQDARRAARLLLARGPVRCKPARASGGRGQCVVGDAAGLDRFLAAADAAELRAHGLVLEEHLSDVRTFSVGQVRVAGLVASYVGVQRLARNNHGEEVFGGSDLDVVRGDWPALLAAGHAPEVQRALEQALRYDAAARACFAGFFASRSNYDVVLGRDGAGRWRCGVLEQSWRAGGATGAELAALEVFRREPARTRVRTACVEVFGDSPEPPAHATVYFRGTDPRVGRLTKYTVVRSDVHPR